MASAGLAEKLTLQVATAPAQRRDGLPWSKPAVFWGLQAAGWSGFAAVMFYWALEYWTLRNAIVNKALLISSGFLLSLALRKVYRSLRRRRLSVYVTLLIIVGVSGCAAAVWLEFELAVFQAYLDRSQGLRFVPLSTGLYLFYVFVMLSWSLLYCGVNAWLDADAQRARAAVAEAEAQKARLRALQSQLEPHFLFNTLNSISTLVIERCNDSAAEMIGKLSEFLRMALDTAETPEITLAEELEFARKYLAIQQVRFGGRLRYSFDIQQECYGERVPVLVLQPLVENALKHGILPRESGGSLQVTARRQNNMLRITVSDDGVGCGPAAMKRGVGLSNVEQRLLSMYGEGARLLQVSEAGRGMSFVVELPSSAALAGRDR